jgi:hypothetical protein
MLHTQRRWALAFTGLILIAALILVAPHALAQDSTTHEVELVGAIQAIESPAMLTINGLTVDASAAEVTTPLQVGLAVHVEGILLDDGSVQAREVQAAEQGILPGELEIVGTLNSLDASSAVVSGLSFDVSGAEIDPGLTVGEMVKAHASLSDTGTWVAREITRATDTGTSSQDMNSDDASGHDANDDSSGTSGESFEIIGTLDAMGDGSIVVSGQTVDIHNAEIQGTLVEGSLVKVELSLVDGNLVAREVKSVTAADTSSSGDSQSGSNADDSSGTSSDSGSGSSDAGDDHKADACQLEVEASSANLRSGPGTGFDAIGFAFEGDHLPVLEAHNSGDWVRVAGSQGDAWIATSVGKLDGNCSALPVSSTPVHGTDNTGRDGTSSDNSGHDSNTGTVDDSGNHSTDSGSGTGSNGGSNSGTGSDSGGGHGSDDGGNHG